METVSSRRSVPSAAWAGVAFFILYVVGFMMIGSSPDDTDSVKDSPSGMAAAWRDHYSDSGRRWVILIAAFLLAAAVLALVVFTSELRQRLADAGAPAAGRLAFAASLLFGAVTLAGASAMAWIPGAKQFGDSPLPEGELNYMASQLGFALLLLGGGASAALLLVTSGRAGVRTHVLPTWLGWAGVVIGIALFFVGVLFIPMALFALWVLIAAITMIRKPTMA